MPTNRRARVYPLSGRMPREKATRRQNYTNNAVWIVREAANINTSNLQHFSYQ